MECERCTIIKNQMEEIRAFSDTLREWDVPFERLVSSQRNFLYINNVDQNRNISYRYLLKNIIRILYNIHFLSNFIQIFCLKNIMF